MWMFAIEDCFTRINLEEVSLLVLVFPNKYNFISYWNNLLLQVKYEYTVSEDFYGSMIVTINLHTKNVGSNLE